METQKFEQQRMQVEILGHKTLYGFCTEEEHLGTMMLRVDTINFTQYFPHNSVFSLLPIDEETYKACCRDSTKPVDVYTLPMLSEYRDLERKYRQIREAHPDWKPEKNTDDELPF